MNELSYITSIGFDGQIALSFFSFYLFLFVPVRDSSARKIVRRQLHRHFIAGKNLDEVHAHFAGDMSEHFMPVLQLDAKRRIGQRFENGSVYFN